MQKRVNKKPFKCLSAIFRPASFRTWIDSFGRYRLLQLKPMCGAFTFLQGWIFVPKNVPSKNTPHLFQLEKPVSAETVYSGSETCWSENGRQTFKRLFIHPVLLLIVSLSCMPCALMPLVWLFFTAPKNLGTDLKSKGQVIEWKRLNLNTQNTKRHQGVAL